MILFEENDDRFYISYSTMRGAGRGVFAARDIKSGEILPITGVLVRTGSTADRTTCFLDRYKFASETSKTEDGIQLSGYTICPLGFAALVNHTNSKRKQNVEISYIGEDSTYSCRAVYRFLRDVRKDEEILGNYGPSGESLEISNTGSARPYRPIFRKRS